MVFQFLTGMLGEVGKAPAGLESAKPVWQVLLGSVLAVPVVYFLLSQNTILGFVLIGLMVCLAAYFIFSGISSKDSVQRNRYIAMLILFSANTLFWALFEQAGSSLNFLAEKYVDAPFHFSVFQSFNAFFIVALAPVFAALWPWLDKRSLNPSIPMKFAFALIGVGLGFLILVMAIRASNPGEKIGWIALGVCYLIHTVAELCLSPIGLSMVTKLAKPKEVGLAMGGWFLSTALANYVAGHIAALASGGGGGGGHEQAVDSIEQYGLVFGQLWWTGAIIGGIFLILSPLINKLMHGIK
jgi:POT family proton-dependent oligopeptide transporter